MMNETEFINTDDENNKVLNVNDPVNKQDDMRGSYNSIQQTTLYNNNGINEITSTRNNNGIDQNANPSLIRRNSSSSVIDTQNDDTRTTQEPNKPPTLFVSSNKTENIQNKTNMHQKTMSTSFQGTAVQHGPAIQSRKSSIQSQTQSAILQNFGTSNNQNVHTTPFISRNQNETFQIPIIGYEIMEERARFTIFKLRIDDPRTGLSWMVFRRYTDFVRLYSKLKANHPYLNLPLPGKRWFKDNFDPVFLDDRVRGLQIFVNVVIRKLYSDSTVRDFFCLDEPPPVCDAEPESLALFGALEDTVGALKNQIRQKEETIECLRKKVFYLEEKMKECVNCNPAESSSLKSSVKNDNSVACNSSGSSY